MILDTLISDIVSKLPVLDKFGFDTPEEMEEYIFSALEDVKMDYMIPALGEAFYDSIDSKEQDELTLKEKYIGKAEVYFTLSTFLKYQGLKKVQERLSTSITINQAGINKTYSGENGFSKASGKYLDEAYDSMSKAYYFYGTTLTRAGIVTEWYVL